MSEFASIQAVFAAKQVPEEHPEPDKQTLLKGRIQTKIKSVSKECLKQKVKVIRLERELHRPQQIRNYIDLTSQYPGFHRAVEKHYLADEIKLKQNLKLETQSLAKLETYLDFLHDAVKYPQNYP